MNIQEVEQLTGITKQNIRFYEKQGLIAPERNQRNAYREYGEKDIHDIKIIKLLRKLDMPLPEIQAVLMKEEPLDKAVHRQQEKLEDAKADLEAAIRSCKKIAEYQIDSLDVDQQLAVIEDEERNGGKFAELWDDFKLAATLERRRPEEGIAPNNFESEEKNRHMKNMRLLYRLLSAFVTYLIMQGLFCVFLGMNQRGIVMMVIFDSFIVICGNIWWWKQLK
ncbi:MAG: MerR family transcriptional regulator [Hespellia sp.]|nr:MerR family transcriptional regulator [Hespellia sp.]